MRSSPSDPSRTEPASGIAALRRKPAASRPDRPARPEWFGKRARRERTTVTEPAYANSYENLAFTRDDDGVLVLRFHTNGGPVIFAGRTHEGLPHRARADLARPRQQGAGDHGQRRLVHGSDRRAEPGRDPQTGRLGEDPHRGRQGSPAAARAAAARRRRRERAGDRTLGIPAP